jgi:hypothetical protein
MMMVHDCAFDQNKKKLLGRRKTSKESEEAASDSSGKRPLLAQQYVETNC